MEFSMKIGFSFYGLTYGLGGKYNVGTERDFRHCWPNLKRMLIDPFVSRGHETEIYFSTYHFTDQNILTEFKKIVNPDKVVFTEIKDSDGFTTKGSSFINFVHNDKLDLIVFCRNDMHFRKIIADENIDYNKFNFLFKEKEWWDNFRFTCDNFYIFPQKMAPLVMKAMYDTYAWPRGRPYVDTHGLYLRLLNYIPENYVHFLSDEHEISDVNSFYTLCRTGLVVYKPEDGRGRFIHPEVKERFGYP